MLKPIKSILSWMEGNVIIFLGSLDGITRFVLYVLDSFLFAHNSKRSGSELQWVSIFM